MAKIYNADNNTLVTDTKGNDYIYNSGDGVTITTGTGGNDSIDNHGHNASIDAGAGNDLISLRSGNNRLILYKTGDGNDTVYGFDATDTLSISGGDYTTQLSGSSIIVTTGTGTITLIDAASFSPYIETGNDTTSGGGSDTQSGGGDDTQQGGDGNDTLDGGSGNDSLTGGDGSDVFYYTAGDGNDTITDYDEDDDKIVIDGEVTKFTTTAKGNALIYVGEQRIVVAGGANKKIRYVDKAVNVSLNADGTAINLLNNYRDNTFDVADYGSGIKTITASAVEYDIAITGNKNDNMILGSKNNDYIYGGAGKDVLYGGEGNDTLLGGTGNDTLWGGDGADTFFYADGDGKDFISDFDEGDMLEITGTWTAAYSSTTNNVTFKVGSTANAITLEDFNATSLNINGDTYRISGSKLMRNA